MKKILVLFVAALVAAPAFAQVKAEKIQQNLERKLSVAAPKPCADKAELEQRMNSVKNDYFVAQFILINLADPLATMTDEDALPKAQCYATYNVKGKRLTDFVWAHADEFRDREAAELRTFAGRVEALNEKVEFDKIAKQSNNYFIAQNILINLADPFVFLTDKEATPKAAQYAKFRVGDRSMVEFIRAFAGEFQPKEEKELLTFAGRVEALNEKVAFDQMAKQNNNYFIAQNILINLADPFALLTDKEAAPKAVQYAKFRVKNRSMVEFVRAFAGNFLEREEAELRAFADRVEQLNAAN